MKRAVFVCVFLLLPIFSFAQGQSVREFPPSVVKTSPQCGEIGVDAAATKQISVTFSKDMLDRSWSWGQVSADSFPKIIGQPRYIDPKTCVVDVELEPGKTYVVWINTGKLTNFKDTDGKPAIPYLLVFQTK
ncbi:Ig-like domain-containing protein [Desulfomonile tiedjei]|uniref:Ig-like domain-containing protein n=1 Tax=Desulfomonile tiedjei TaxID=2358 RepID=UPI0002F4180D|nr:Ig-like domain-containing protein [Desulfomonile tiedjei]